MSGLTTLAVVSLMLGGLIASPAASVAQEATPTANPLEPLGFLVGRWRFSTQDSVYIKHPEARQLIIFEYDWVVGRNAIRFRENIPMDGATGAELEGLIIWDPALEQIQQVAVGGHGEKQGRLFRGEYRDIGRSRVERIYDVYYRTAEDTPGEELGGSRRRYREVLELQGPNRLRFTLEWWLQGRWQPFGQGTYLLER